MNRIPTEGLKLLPTPPRLWGALSLNEQNPDRGIETYSERRLTVFVPGLNEQNPDRGIETGRDG